MGEPGYIERIEGEPIGFANRTKVGTFAKGHTENNTRPRTEKGTWLPKGGSSCFDDKFNIVSLTDWHVPFEDANAINAALGFCESVQPSIIILHELHDFYGLSKFDKDPARLDGLQEEIDQVSNYFDRIRKTCPGSRIILLKSNHLDRLRRYLWSHAQAFSSLRALEIPTLLGLDQFGIEYKDSFIYRNFLFKHGNLVSKEAGMTARRELAAEGLSGVSGHTHRLGQIYFKDRSGEYTWIESGCLCDLDPEYIDGVANWKHGLSIVSFRKNHDTYFATPIPIIQGEVPFM